ncbi:MAG: type IV pilin [Halobacteriaceae archaeon]
MRVEEKEGLPGMSGTPDGGRAISPVVGILLMLAIVVALGAVTTVLLLDFGAVLSQPAPLYAQDSSVEVAVVNGSIANQTLVLDHRGGDAVAVDTLRIHIRSNGTTIVRSVPHTGDVSDGTWSPGETLPLALTTAQVCRGGDHLQIEVVYQGEDTSHIVSTEQVPIRYGGFTIRDGSLVPVTDYTATATVIGTGLTYGSPGPNIPIFLTVQIGGRTYTPWPGNVNNPNNPRTHTFTDQPAGAPIDVAATRAAYGYLDSATRWSNGSTDWVRVLRDGERPPNIQGYGGQASIAGYVDPYVNDSTGRIEIAANQAIYLFELGTSPTGAAADYQDIVVLVSLQTQADTVRTVTTADGDTAVVCPTTP